MKIQRSRIFRPVLAAGVVAYAALIGVASLAPGTLAFAAVAALVVAALLLFVYHRLARPIAVAEMVGDKWPKSPNRTVLSGSTARFLTAAAAGASLAPRDRRVAGGQLAALTAVTTAHLGLAARLRSMQRWSQARTGFVEDALLLAGTALLIHQVARPARAAA